MKVILATENGVIKSIYKFAFFFDFLFILIIKVIRVENKKILYSYGKQDRDKEIVGLCWGRGYPEKESEIVVCFKDGTILVINIEEGTQVLRLRYKIGIVKGMGLISDDGE